MPSPVALTLGCFLAAAAHQGIPAPIMWGLYATEGGWVGAAQRNTDGSHDLGPMQINDSTWVHTIGQLIFAGDDQKARELLQWDGCFNAEVSAWIYHQYLVEDQGNLAAAVGHYNSHSPGPMARYQATYERKFLQMYGMRLTTPPTSPVPVATATSSPPKGSPRQHTALAVRPAASDDAQMNGYLAGTIAPPRPQ